MGRLAMVWLVAAAVPSGPPEQAALQRFEFTATEMAVAIHVVLYAPGEPAATAAARAAFDRIAQLNAILSDYDPTSEVRRLCDAAAQRPVAVSNELWQVLAAAQGFSRESQGAFDVTVGPVVRLWRRARRRYELPDPERLAAARQLVGYQLVELDPQTRSVRLRKAGMHIDLGAIAKGYAAQEALKTLVAHGIDRALVDAGGDIVVGNAPPERPGWKIGVAALEPDGPPTRYFWLKNAAVATSGATWQFVELGGQRYSHLIDPRTGMAITGQMNVTVIAADGMTADALASAVSVLGPAEGIKLIERTAGTAALILRKENEKLETFESQRWKTLAPAVE